MADVQQVLDTYADTTLDANGRGQVSLAPEGFRIWTVTVINVRTSQGPTETPVPQCTAYLGAIGRGSIVSQTWMGNRSTATGALVVQPSQPLILVWENGVPGSEATVSLYGSMAMR